MAAGGAGCCSGGARSGEAGRHGGGWRRKARGRADRRREEGWSEDLFRWQEERDGGSWVGHDLLRAGTGRWGKTTE